MISVSAKGFHYTSYYHGRKTRFRECAFSILIMLEPPVNAATCLRQIAEVSAPDDVECWTIISPKRLASLTGDCPYYRSNKKTRYAMGFINILDSLPYKQMQEVSKYLISHFGQSTYYRARKGTRPLLPTEQQFVLETLKRCKADSCQEFDAYYEDYDWE